MSFEDLTNAYNLLGCTPEMSLEEIKKVYKKLAKENHPDVAEDKEFATVKMAAINDAFDLVKEAIKNNIRLEDLKTDKAEENYYTYSNYRSYQRNNETYQQRKKGFRKSYNIYKYYREMKEETIKRKEAVDQKLKKIIEYIKNNGEDLEIKKEIQEIFKLMENKKIGIPTLLTRIENKIVKVEEIIKRKEKSKNQQQKAAEQRMADFIFSINDFEKSKVAAHQESWNAIPAAEIEAMENLVLDLYEAFRKVKKFNEFQLSIFDSYGPAVTRILEDDMTVCEKRYDRCMNQYETAISFYSTFNLLESTRKYFENLVIPQKTFDPYKEFFLEKLSVKYNYLEEKGKDNLDEDYFFERDLIEEHAPEKLIIWYLSHAKDSKPLDCDRREMLLERELLYKEDLSYINEKEQISLKNKLDDIYEEDKKRLRSTEVVFSSTVNYLNKMHGITLNSASSVDELEYERLKAKLEDVKSDIIESFSDKMFANARDKKDYSITPQYLEDVTYMIDFVFAKVSEMIDNKAPIQGVDWYLDMCVGKSIKWYFEKYSKLNMKREHKVKTWDDLEIIDINPENRGRNR